MATNRVTTDLVLAFSASDRRRVSADVVYVFHGPNRRVVSGDFVLVFSDETPSNPPATPTVTASEITQTGALLTGSPFSDADPGSVHQASEFRVRRADTLAIVYTSPTLGAVEAWEIPEGSLPSGTDLIPEARYSDGVLWSAWGTGSQFRTVAGLRLEASAVSTEEIAVRWYLDATTTAHKIYYSLTDPAVGPGSALFHDLGDEPDLEGVVSLLGLEPETTVYFRMEAVDLASGVTYSGPVASATTFSPYVPPPEVPDAPALFLWPDEDKIWVDVIGLEGAAYHKIFFAPAADGMDSSNFATVGTEVPLVTERNYAGGGDWADSPYDGTIEPGEEVWVEHSGLVEGTRYAYLLVAYDAGDQPIAFSTVEEAVFGYYIPCNEFSGLPYEPGTGYGVEYGGRSDFFWRHEKLLASLQPVCSTIGRIPGSGLYHEISVPYVSGAGLPMAILAAAGTAADHGYVAARISLDPNIRGQALFYPHLGMELARFGIVGSLGLRADGYHGFTGVFASIENGLFTPGQPPGPQSLYLHVVPPTMATGGFVSVPLGATLMPWWNTYVDGVPMTYHGQTAVLELEYAADLDADPLGFTYDFIVRLNGQVLITQTYALGEKLLAGPKGISSKSWGGAAQFSSLQASRGDMPTEPPGLITGYAPCTGIVTLTLTE